VPRIETGADELVAARTEGGPQGAEAVGVAGDPGRGRQAGALGGEDVLQAVVVGAGDEADVAAAAAAVTGEGVGEHDLEGEAEVRTRVDERDGGGQEGRGHGHGSWK